MDWLQLDNPVALWRVTLRVAEVLNTTVWLLVKRHVLRGVAPADCVRVASVALCGGLYTVGCAFRSVLPRADVERFCL